MYKFAVNKENYEDYSSGRVLYGATGSPNFSVRLSSEIFQRCLSYLESKGRNGPYTVYDPFCGAGYSLTVIGLLHGTHIKSVIASDANKDMMELAQKNLSLLSEVGLEQRMEQLQKMIQKYGKTSHKEALGSAERLTSKINRDIPIQCFEFNILSNANMSVPAPKIDIVITDLPYGKLSEWKGKVTANPAQEFLNNIKLILNQNAIVAISFDKQQTVLHEGYNRVKSFNVGKRKILLLEQIA